MSQPQKSMLFRECAGVLLCVHTAAAPSKDEWEGYVQYCEQLPKSVTKTAVYTAGGGPDAMQRKVLQDRYLDKQRRHNPVFRVAVITDSKPVKFIVQALNMFNEHTNSFSWDSGAGVPAAMKHLGIVGAAAGQISLELEKMRRELGIK